MTDNKEIPQEVTQVIISKIMVESRHRLPVSRDDKFVHVVNIPEASQRIYDLFVLSQQALEDAQSQLSTLTTEKDDMISALELRIGDLYAENAKFRENVIETLYSHYKNHGGFTNTAARFIEKLTGEQWGRDQEIIDLRAENAKLKEELKSFYMARLRLISAQPEWMNEEAWKEYEQKLSNQP